MSRGKGKASGPVRQGDWNCPECGNHNWSMRTQCNKCGLPRPANIEAPQQDYSAPPPPRRKRNNSGGGGWGAEDAFADDDIPNGHGPPPGGHGPPPPPPPPGGGPVVTGKNGRIEEIREGDWNCPNCNNHNYATRASCRKCNAPRPPEAGPPAPHRNRGGGQQQQLQQGKNPNDWNCPNCGDLNYASRNECRKCGTAKPYDPNRDQQSHQKRPVMKPGDWICPNCQDMNYSTRNSCRKCGTGKPSSDGLDPDTLNAVLSLVAPGIDPKVVEQLAGLDAETLQMVSQLANGSGTPKNESGGASTSALAAALASSTTKLDII
jgi:predicted RNA-binding Zn-ribbon protein involved in translation (DUF1610 family)